MKFQNQIEQVPRDDAARIDQQMLLYWLIRGSKPKICVEIGTHRGSTALYLAHALYDNGLGKLITCDPYDYGQDDTFKQIPELNNFIEFRKQRGNELDVDNIDFLFIDGFHEYEAVRDEILYLFPRLSSEAIVVFHDCGGDNELVGVNKAIEEAKIKTVWLPMSGKMRIYNKYD